MQRPRTISEFVYEKLKNHILAGIYNPGERLIETNLAKELEVSRTPVRDALHRLESDGLITTSPHRGIFVRKLSKKAIRDFYQTRAVLEGLASKLAALNATEEELEQFATFIEEMKEIFERDKDLPSYEAIAKSNNKFHGMICAMAKNEVLAKMLSDLESPITLVRTTSWRNDNRKQRTFKEHYNIASAILERNAEAAQKLTEKHIDNVWESAKTVLDRQEVKQ